MSRDHEDPAGASRDLDRTLSRVRRRLTWHRRLDLGVRGLLIGAGGAFVVIVWHAVVDPGMPWRPGAALALAAGLLPCLAYALRRRVTWSSAAWFLDRKLTAGGRILTLREHRPPEAEGPRESAFLPRIEAEVSGLLGGSWSPSWSRPVRGLSALAVIGVASGLLLLLGPAASGPVTTTDAPPAASGPGRNASALERLAGELRSGGEAALAERLARAAERLARGQATDPETERLFEELEERLRRHGVLVTLRTVLESSPAGKALARRLLDGDTPDTHGDGVAVTTPDGSREQIALLERVARLPGLPEGLERDLERAVAALRSGNRDAFDAAAAALREQLGREAPAALLAESAERLAALRAGAVTSRAARPSPGGETRPAGGAEKPGPASKPDVRGEPETTTVLDPNLRRVIRRYFASRGQEHE